MSSPTNGDHILIEAANQSGTDFERLGKVFKLCAEGLPSAQEVKALMQAALSGSEAGEAWRQALLAELQAPTPEAKRQLVRLGVNQIQPDPPVTANTCPIRASTLTTLKLAVGEASRFVGREGERIMIPRPDSTLPELIGTIRYVDPALDTVYLLGELDDVPPANSAIYLVTGFEQDLGGRLADLQPHRGMARTHGEDLAQAFHEAYEDLAPDFGYSTREASRKPWADVPEQNKRLMVATADRILQQFPALQRGAMWELDTKVAEIHAYEPKPDPSLERMAIALETFVSNERESQAAHHSAALRIASGISDDFIRLNQRHLTLVGELARVQEQLAHKQGVIDRAYDALNEFGPEALDSLPGILEAILGHAVTPPQS